MGWRRVRNLRSVVPSSASMQCVQRVVAIATRKDAETASRPHSLRISTDSPVTLLNAHSRANAKANRGSTVVGSGSDPTAMTSSCVAIGTTSLCAARCSPPTPTATRRDGSTPVRVCRCQPLHGVCPRRAARRRRRRSGPNRGDRREAARWHQRTEQRQSPQLQ